ncbi:MAG: efflux RND transporter periplasmic adaptor subunit [Sideroxydans sp.]|nr:efflux RND transporter periplasmic adaptor subunit [Sideroxydans sp.]
MKLALLFAALCLSACSKSSPPAAPVERAAVTQLVGTLGDASERVYSGEIRARHEVSLGFRVGGKITQRLVEAGTVVTAGQVLARLDSRDAGLQASAAEAQFQLAEAEVKRYRVLLSKNFVSQSALDAKEAALQALSAQAGLARNQSGYSNLVAAKSGVVMATFAEVGQVVAAGQTVLKLAEDGAREVAIAIPESDYANLSVGAKATVSLWSSRSVDEQIGRLRELSPAADAASRSYAARVSLPDNQLPLGMTAQVKFVSKNVAPRELLVPLTAIFQQGNNAAVWIVAADHSVSLRPVQVAQYSDEGALIASGIKAGERIVSNGVHKIVAGEKIHAIENGSAQ